MKAAKSAIVLLLLGLAIASCKKDENAPTATNTGCTDLTLGGSAIPETAGPGLMPSPAGGTIADGTYHLTRWDIYPPGSIDPYRRTQTFKIAGNRLELINQRDSDPVQKGSGTIAVSGSSIVITMNCPSASLDTIRFTVSGMQLMFVETSDNEVHVLTKQ